MGMLNSMLNTVDAARLHEGTKPVAKKHFIKGMDLKKGALHRDLGVPEGEKIPEDKLRSAVNSKDKLVAKRARTAMMLEGLHHKPAEKTRRSAKETRHAMYGGKD